MVVRNINQQGWTPQSCIIIFHTRMNVLPVRSCCRCGTGPDEPCAWSAAAADSSTHTWKTLAHPDGCWCRSAELSEEPNTQHMKYIKWLTWEKTTMYRFGAFCLALFPLRNRFDPFNWLLNDVWLVSESLVVYVHTVPPPVWAEQVHIEGRDAGRQGRSGRRAGCLSR